LFQAAQDCQTAGDFSAVSGCDVHMSLRAARRGGRHDNFVWNFVIQGIEYKELSKK